jgi:collagenase-like PrtC family protease
MTIIEDSGHPFSVKASTICQISSAFKAEHYRNLGIERVVIDEDITRDFGRIRQVCEAFGDGVEMIVNSTCIKDCPNKMKVFPNRAGATGRWPAHLRRSPSGDWSNDDYRSSGAGSQE